MQIRLVKNKNGLNEWTIMELQGTFEINGPLNGELFGKLAWKGNGKIAELTIGHQLLEGHLVRLEKPFLVMNRASLREDEPCEDIPKGERKVCDIVAIVRQKIVFTERPKPIIIANSQ